MLCLSGFELYSRWLPLFLESFLASKSRQTKKDKNFETYDLAFSRRV